MLNAPRMESSKNWMLCSVSALHSFLHRKHKQEFTPSPEGSAAHRRHQEIGELLVLFLFFFFIARLGLRLCALHVPQVSSGWVSCGGSAHTGIALQLSAPVPASLLQHTATCLCFHTAGGWLHDGVNSCLFLMVFTFARTWCCLVGVLGKYLKGWKIYQDCGAIITEK